MNWVSQGNLGCVLSSGFGVLDTEEWIGISGCDGEGRGDESEPVCAMPARNGNRGRASDHTSGLM